MKRLTLMAVCALAVTASAAFAQTPARSAPAPSSQAPAAPTAQATPRSVLVAAPPASSAPKPPATKPINVKIEFTITDNRGNETPVKRSVSVIASDGNLGRVRSTSQVLVRGMIKDIPLYVDATPTLQPDGKVKLQFTLSYDWPAPVPINDAPSPNVPVLTNASLSDSVSLILEDGKSMIAAQSADPIGDRQVTVEVKATVLK